MKMRSLNFGRCSLGGRHHYLTHYKVPKVFVWLKNSCSNLSNLCRQTSRAVEARHLRQPQHLSNFQNPAGDTSNSPQNIDLNKINDPITFDPISMLVKQNPLPLYTLALVHTKASEGLPKNSGPEPYYAKTVIQWTLSQIETKGEDLSARPVLKDIYNGLPTQKIEFKLFRKHDHQQALSVSWSPDQKNGQGVDPVLQLILKMENSNNEKLARIYCLALSLAIVNGPLLIFPSKYFPKTQTQPIETQQPKGQVRATEESPAGNHSENFYSLFDDIFQGMDHHKRFELTQLAIVALAHLAIFESPKCHESYKAYLQELIFHNLPQSVIG